MPRLNVLMTRGSLLHSGIGLLKAEAGRTVEMPAEPAATQVIDLRALANQPPGADILSMFDHLGTGESFILINDNACRQLYRTFVQQRGGQFSWTYLRAISGDWRIRVGKKPGSTPDEGGGPPQV